MNAKGIISRTRRAIDSMLGKQYPQITCFQSGENEFRVITRDALGTEIRDIASSPEEMKRIADDRFRSLVP